MYLFDMDGTLIDSNDVWKDVDREFLARRGLPYTKAYYEGVAHTIFPLAAKFTKEFCNLPDSEEDIMAEWMELAKDAYAHVTVKPGVRAFLKPTPDFCNFYVLFICQSFRYSGFQSSSSKLLIYTSQKDRISFSSAAKKPS